MTTLPALVEIEKRHERNGIRLRDARVNQMPKWAYIAALESHDDCGHLLRIVKEMQEALKECADGLEEYVEAYYAKTKEYPSELRRYERDIEPVLEARKLLSAPPARVES